MKASAKLITTTLVRLKCSRHDPEQQFLIPRVQATCRRAVLLSQVCDSIFQLRDALSYAA